MWKKWEKFKIDFPCDNFSSFRAKGLHTASYKIIKLHQLMLGMKLYSDWLVIDFFSDIEPPTIVSCPKDIYTDTVPKKSWASVAWNLPQFYVRSTPTLLRHVQFSTPLICHDVNLPQSVNGKSYNIERQWLGVKMWSQHIQLWNIVQKQSWILYNFNQIAQIFLFCVLIYLFMFFHCFWWAVDKSPVHRILFYCRTMFRLK